jgi:predicted unusual protein kinase regulating ubiquinone biosynthesis (AarF/ABC1/UbiB family)
LIALKYAWLAGVLGQIMGTITQRLGKYGICLRGDISACMLTISVSEGLLLNLDPTYDIVTRAAPYFVRYRSFKSIEHVMSHGYNTGEKAGDGTKLKPVKATASTAPV